MPTRSTPDSAISAGSSAATSSSASARIGSWVPEVSIAGAPPPSEAAEPVPESESAAAPVAAGTGSEQAASSPSGSSRPPAATVRREGRSRCGADAGADGTPGGAER